MWTWISDIFRSILSLFDRVVYWFLELLVALFDQIASVRVFENDTIKAFSERIFFLVTVIMVFKVSFSIIKYIINPDTFSDNERGMGKVIQNVILVLVSLVCIQPIFQFSYDLQDRILESQIIEKVILGVKIDENTDGVSADEQKNVKDRIPFNLLTSFIRPNAEYIPELSYNPDKKMYMCKTTKEFGMYKEVGGVASADYNTGFGTCLNDLTGEKEDKYQKSNGDTMRGLTGDIYNEAQDSYNYSMLLDIINHKYKNDSNQYLFDYKFVVSTAAGIFVAIMYLNFCIDLAIRAVKFGFLQLIAPIPIISMIDPKSAKSGMMSKWVHNCIGTYLGLFIRIAVVNFAIFVINLVFSNKITITSGGEAGLFLKVVILFGAIMFAKEAPKLINELTGGKLGGDFKMNPFSRVPIAGKAITGTAKATGALAGGIIGTAGHLGFAGLSTGAAALGSVGQAAFGAARGRGWNFNSDRVAREWKLGRDKMRNSGVGGVNGALTNMGSIVGAKPKGIPTGSDRKNSANQEYKMMQKKYNQGQKIEEQIARMRAEAEQRGEELTDDKINNAIYTNSDFASDVTNVQSAKREMINAENRYNELMARSNAGDMVATGELASASKNLADSKSRYNIRKEMLDKKGAQSKYASDYRRYEARKAYKDASDSVSNGNGPSTQYLRELFSSDERPSISSDRQSDGAIPTVTPPSRSGNGNNGNNNP